MTLIVCPLHDFAAVIQKTSPARIVSLLSPGHPEPEHLPNVPRLRLNFHDIVEPQDGLIPPSEEMIRALLDFGAAWAEPGPMVVHCWMGISRSPAAALVLASACDPSLDERELAELLRAKSPMATPNSGIIAIADKLLGRGGRLKAAVESIGRGEDAPHGITFQIFFSRCANPGTES